MAATMIAAPRYSTEDFETRSIASAAPSYRSDAPSYHSADYRSEPTPAYTPREVRGTPSSSAGAGSGSQQRIGLPPMPPVATGMLSMHNYRIPTWSTHNAPAARQYQSVVDRRVNAERERARNSYQERPRTGTLDRSTESVSESSNTVRRPLEDPYLVGEEAAAQARRERLIRESGDDILIREDQQWDWLLVQMRSWESRERSWAKFRRELDSNQRKPLLRRMGGRLV